MTRSTLVAVGVLLTGLSFKGIAGEGCGVDHSSAPAMKQIQVSEEYKSKEEKLLAYKKKYGDVSHKELIKAIESGKALIIDVNGPDSYKKAHVTGAVSFHDKEALKAALPKDKGTLVIQYCGGPKCGAWCESADYMSSQGYTNIKHYSEGIKGWLARKRGSDKSNRDS